MLGVIAVLSVLAGFVFTSGLEFTRTESMVTSQGQKYNAAIVIDISRELENVLVEQNHCHGLKTLMSSWHRNISQYPIIFDALLTAAQAVSLPTPNSFSAIFHVQ